MIKSEFEVLDKEKITMEKPKSQKKVVVAMSGGVDSSVAATLLKEQGYEVIGVTMNLYSLPKEVCLSENLKSCCGRQAQEDANRVAVALGISHYVVDFRREFEQTVIEDFSREYWRGRTPNPCIRCNQFIKFDLFLERANKLGADHIATGHYARVERDPTAGRYLLKKGKDKDKDQSYFLYTLTQKQLAQTIFPVGGLTKKDVRTIAAKYTLPVADKEESQEICFVPDKDYAKLLKNRIPEAFRPGPILDLEGRVLGEHDGIIHFTVGQRKGMGIAARHPLYVLAIDANKNAIVVGKNEDLYRSRLEASGMNFISIEKLDEPKPVQAKIRYKHAEARATIFPSGAAGIRVEFEKPQRAVTPGQAVVFYAGDTVVGGGIID
jgi:tRNA-specific 2-thiouridylase